MNQKETAKVFAIFVGVIMVLSAFASFVMRSGDPGASVSGEDSDIETANLAEFGVNGRLLDMNFESLGDVLDMCPQDTVSAYWIDMNASQNLTDSARAVLPSIFPPSIGLQNPSGIYVNPIKRVAVANFNKSWVEFHWIKPFKVGYQGLVLPYNDYMIIPASSEATLVMGRPTLFGPQLSVQAILDVVTGSLPTDRITLPYEVGYADLQIAGLGVGSGVSSSPIGGSYDEYYIGITKGDGDTYSFVAKYVTLTGASETRITTLSRTYGMVVTKGSDGVASVTGKISAGKLAEVLKAFLSS